MERDELARVFLDEQFDPPPRQLRLSDEAGAGLDRTGQSLEMPHPAAATNDLPFQDHCEAQHRLPCRNAGRDVA